ncbi:MAG: DUF4338 domain-containing protein [Nitrococcus sp.]|nr:DUF4338 domain-containing protein [Nitrococcus sp.]
MAARSRHAGRNAVRYCGRHFSDAEITTIRRLIEDHPNATRYALSWQACELLGWRRPNGQRKDMSCRVAMLRMHEHGVITLPPPRTRNGNGKRVVRRSAQAEPAVPLHAASPREIGPLLLEPIQGPSASLLYNEYLDRYHYLGYQPLPGDQQRYFVRAAGVIVALLGFGAAAWKCRPRDDSIGWQPKQREQRLHRIVNNARFLILPWVHCPNLASAILARAAKRLPNDWQQRYAYQPVLLETFVELPRFLGTAYQAANWQRVGQTQGRGKLDVHHRAALPRKSVWLYPLRRDFRRILCARNLST